MANQVCKIDSGKIVNGSNLLSYSSLQKWDSDLSSLENGDNMLYWCTALDSFSCNNLNKLVHADQMFGHTKIQSFTYDMINLESGAGMFYQCPNLTNFKSNLNSLITGSGMFYGCTLTDESIHNIASGLNRYPTDKGFTNNISIGTRTVPLFDSTLKDIGIMKAKGWNPVCGGIYSSGIPQTPWAHQIFYYCTSVSDMESASGDYKTAYIINGVWNEHLSDLTDGTGLFLRTYEANGTRFTKFNADLSSLVTGESMFDTCYDLTAFDSNLNALENGFYMFNDCSSLTSFNVNLPSLTRGYNMFAGCRNLTTFNSNLSNLTQGSYMLYACSALTTFDSDLSSLTNGHFMFGSCTNLTTFNSNLSSLTKGWVMFSVCSNLTTFDSDLSNLTNGWYMFYNCKLDTASVKKIANTIKDVTSLTNGTGVGDEVYKHIHIGIGNSTPTTEEQGYLNTIASRGWTVYVNGSAYTPTGVASVMTLDEIGNEVETPIPFYAKPIASDEEHAEYVDADGNYYNILGAQFIYGDDLSTYGMFTNEEDAAATMGLTKIEK